MANDPSRMVKVAENTYVIEKATEPKLGIPVGQTVLKNVHDEDKCAGSFCVVHNPSDHHMRSWPLNFRADTGVMERLCPAHGVGHPDPDSSAFQASGSGWVGIHGCCGCCR